MQQDNNSAPKQAMVNKVFGSVFGNVEQHFDAPLDTDKDSSPRGFCPSQNEGTEGSRKEGVRYESPVYLTKEPRGFKIDLIRVINVLYMLGFFTGKDGRKVTKKDVFAAIGKAVNVDFENYDKDLSRSLSDSTALEKHLSIFDKMKKKMEEVFNNYGGK